MKELIPYIFEHPQYGKLRVVVEEDRIYFDLFMPIDRKSVV